MLPVPKERPDRPSWEAVPADIVQQIESIIGDKIVDVSIAVGGYGPSATFIVTTSVGKKFFTKGSHPRQDTHGSKALEQEITACLILERVTNISPRYLGRADLGDDDDWHLAIFEYVPKGQTTLPWNEKKIAAVFDVLKIIHMAQPDLTPVFQQNFMGNFVSGKNGWHRILHEAPVRRNFLSIFADRLAAENWLSIALPVLLAASPEALNMAGPIGAIHGDLRSDNILFDAKGRVFLIDWTNACLGPVILDLVFFLSGLSAESGMTAQRLLEVYQARSGFIFDSRDVKSALACVSGYYAVNAGKAVPQRLPQLRWMQKQHLWGALCWISDGFALPVPPLFLECS